MLVTLVGIVTAVRALELNAEPAIPVTVRVLIVLGIDRAPLPEAENPVMTTPPLPSDVVVYEMFDSVACAAAENVSKSNNAAMHPRNLKSKELLNISPRL
jgi:hypothetical protein